MPLQECPWCQARVVPTPDGRCPACAENWIARPPRAGAADGRSSASDWLRRSLKILSHEGFVISENVADCDIPTAMARRSRFEFLKFGIAETFFVFRRFDSINVDALQDFSSEAFHLAKQSKTCPLPCGLFESVWCFAVAVTDHIDSVVAESVRKEVPPRHWAAAEIPVIFNQSEGRLYFFEKTPIWGAAYYAGFRSEIQRCLGHNVTA
jgi:hypothetical protein